MQFDLVFEGGGAKGMVFVGAMQAFEAAGYTYGRLIGTSAGAITATTLAAGYSAEEMLAALTEQQDGQPVFSTFLASPGPFAEEDVNISATAELLRAIDVPFIPNFLEEKIDARLALTLAGDARFRHVFSFVERGGWYSAHDFVTWLRRKLDEGTYKGEPRRFSEMTLAEMYEVTKTDLTLTGSDITDGRLLILNHRTAPDLPVVWAVRMSMSVPLLWQEVIWLEEWGTYRGKSLTDHAIVDGGLLSNFPIELLVSDAAQVTAVMGEKVSQNVLGFLIDETLPVANAPALAHSASPLSGIGSLRTAQRLQQLVNTVTQARDKMVIDEFNHLVVRCPAQGYGTTEFDMDAARRDALVTAGRDALVAYLSTPETTMEKAVDLETLERTAAAADRVAIGILER